MTIPGQIKRDPRFIYLTDYMSPEEAAKVVASGIAINQVGFVPSMQVPPGNRGCQGLGVSLLEAAGDIPAPTVDWWGNISTGTTSLSPGGGSPGAVYPGGTAPGQTKSDKALSWIEDNWVVIAGGLGVLLAVSMLTRR